MARKSQSSFEFTLIILTFIIVFSVFLIFFESKMGDVENEKNIKLLENVGKMVESEINMASLVQGGYSRNLTLPARIDGKPYYVEFKNASTMGTDFSVFSVGYVDTDITKNQYVFFAYPDISGKLTTDGENNITREMSGRICINYC